MNLIPETKPKSGEYHQETPKITQVPTNFGLKNPYRIGFPPCMLRASPANRCMTPFSFAYAGRHREIPWKEPIPGTAGNIFHCSQWICWGSGLMWWISGCLLLGLNTPINTWTPRNRTSDSWNQSWARFWSIVGLDRLDYRLHSLWQKTFYTL